MKTFNFKDVTVPHPGLIVWSPAFWLCKDGDPKQALFWGDYPQCNWDQAVVSEQLAAEMYNDVPGLVPVFIDIAFVPFIPGFKTKLYKPKKHETNLP